MPEWWGWGTDPDSGDSTSDDTSGDSTTIVNGPLLTLPDVNWDVLKSFSTSPVSFILGAILSVFLGGLEAVIEAFLDAILAVWEAVTFIPETGAAILRGTFGAAGDMVLGALSGVFETLAMAAAVAGPGAPLVLGGAVAVSIVASAYALQFAWTLLVDSINPL